MRSGLILKKIGMTRIFDDDGNSFPATVMKLEENQDSGWKSLQNSLELT